MNSRLKYYYDGNNGSDDDADDDGNDDSNDDVDDADDVDDDKDLDGVPLVANPGVGFIGGEFGHHVSV